MGNRIIKFSHSFEHQFLCCATFLGRHFATPTARCIIVRSEILWVPGGVKYCCKTSQKSEITPETSDHPWISDILLESTWNPKSEKIFSRKTATTFREFEIFQNGFFPLDLEEWEKSKSKGFFKKSSQTWKKKWFLKSHWWRPTLYCKSINK